jgi:ApaG protein
MTTKQKYLIEVSVKTEYLADNSDATANRYVFAYHINIHNAGELAAKLVSRHWLITDGNEQTEEVKGAGVVGEQPEIEPGETYGYTSGAALRTPVGIMQGSYQMLAADGTRFEAPIPPFSLAIPEQLH